MGYVLYCIGTCQQIMVASSSGIDGSETHGSGCFICEDCEKAGTADQSHPFAKFAQTEKQVKENAVMCGAWHKRPVSDVLP